MRTMPEGKFTNYLKAHGYNSVKAFAVDCGCTPQQIFHHIRHRAKPNVATLLHYAKILGVEVDELIELFFPNEWKEYSR